MDGYWSYIIGFVVGFLSGTSFYWIGYKKGYRKAKKIFKQSSPEEDYGMLYFPPTGSSKGFRI